jgi:glycosyltransferase involved in cell wall biosynthesis
MLASHVEIFFKNLRSATNLPSALSMGFVHKMADRITAQNMQQKELFEQNRKRKVDAIIPNVIEDITSHDNDRNRDLILWVGRSVPLKRPELFLIQAKSFPDEKFVMICPPSFDTDYYNHIRAQAELIPNLEFIEYVAPAEMHDYYLRSKIYLLTSEAEGFSNTMMEAMISGTAIVSLSVNPDHIFEQYKLGLYSNNKIGEFETNVGLLINNPEKCKVLAQNAKDYLAIKHIGAEIIEEFKKLLQNLR